MDKTKNLIKLIIENHNKVFDNELVSMLLSNKNASFFMDNDIQHDLGYCSLKMNLWSFLAFSLRQNQDHLKEWENILKIRNPDYITEPSYILKKTSYSYDSDATFTNFFPQDFEIGLDALLSLRDFSLSSYPNIKTLIDFEFKDNKKFFLNEVFSTDKAFFISHQSYLDLVKHTQAFIVSDFSYFLKKYSLFSIKNFSNTLNFSFDNLSKEDLSLVINKYDLEKSLAIYVTYSFNSFNKVKNLLKNYQTKEFWFKNFGYVENGEFSLYKFLLKNSCHIFNSKIEEIFKEKKYSSMDKLSFIEPKKFKEKELIQELEFFKEFIINDEFVNKLLLVSTENKKSELYAYLISNFNVSNAFVKKSQLIANTLNFTNFFSEVKTHQSIFLQKELTNTLSKNELSPRKIKV